MLVFFNDFTGKKIYIQTIPGYYLQASLKIRETKNKLNNNFNFKIINSAENSMREQIAK